MSKLRIAPLGGLGKVTQNLFIYEYEDEMMIVDCGIGFPDSYMPGVDILIPDVEYLLKQLEAGKKLVGMVLTHGHDDHIAATAYITPVLPEFPIYASELTAGFAEQRMRDGEDPRTVQVVKDNKEVKLGTHFSFKLLPITHSVPDTRHVVINTPEGIIYHGSDFKLDPNPVDGKLTAMDEISALKDENVLCMMIDCLRVEYLERVESESKTGPAILQAMKGTEGKVVMTLMSSHLHRIQQTINAAEKLGRKVTFVGRSVEQNVEIALRLGKLNIPDGMKVDKKHMDKVSDKELCVIVAGSQGQEGSSLMRAVFGEHRMLQINRRDTVIFSADAIPGNANSYFGAINELCRNKIHVLYPDVMPDLHKSGHASAPEQQELVGMVRPKYVMPIGGEDRHRFKFYEMVASKLGYDESHVLIPESGQIISFHNREYGEEEHLNLRPQAVDGLGVGDVGPRVLSDRRTLGQAGIVMVLLPKDKKGYDLKNMRVVSRGFVFMKEAQEVVEYIKQEASKFIEEEMRKKTPEDKMLRHLERRLSGRLYKVIRREPMIVAEALEV